MCQAAKVISPSAAVAKPLGKGPGKSTCNGGSIAPGTYDSLTIAGFCTVDEGIVKVKHDVTVQPNAGLLAAFGNGPSLAVGGNLNVKNNAVLVLGCKPESFICFNDPDQEVGSFSSQGTVYGSLKADHALAVLLHEVKIGHDLTIKGGGGGVNCDGQDALFGSPAYATTEDSSVGGNVSIDGWQSCWIGFFRTTVGGNFKLHHSMTADPDGNEIQTNVIKGNMDCSGDDPIAQGGDSGGFANVVFGKATGECTPLSGP